MSKKFTLLFLVNLFFFGCIHKQFVSERTLSSVDYAHGNNQVIKMLSDRPAMKSYVNSSGKVGSVEPSDSIWQWASKKFAGEDLGELIDWNSGAPSGAGCHDADNNTYPTPRIRVRSTFKCYKEEARPFDSLWSSAVFELFNIEGAKEFDELYDQAVACKLTKMQYVRNNLAVEYKAKLKQAEFYQKIWLPWIKDKGIVPSHYWPTKVEPFEVWVKHWADDPEDYWHKYFDEKMQPYLNSIGCVL